MTESQLQSQIIKKINEDGIYNLIGNRNEFNDIANIRYEDDFQPLFSINYLIRDKYLRYSKMILDSLDSDIEIVSGTSIKNISLATTEKLYPDIILYNYENNKYFILELKRSEKAEREAITELLGYRLEMKNHLPFINNGDIPLIIVSTEFNTLLLHSVASLLLDNIPVLCLKPIISDDVFNDFEIINVSAWSNIGIDTLNSQSFEGCTICLYGKENKTIDEDSISDDIWIAIDFLKNDANRISSHGFCIAWKSFGAEKIDNNLTTDFFISIFTINPYNIFHNSNDVFGKQDVLSKHILQETDANFSPSYSYELLTQNMMKFLKNKYTPEYEMFLDYKMFKNYFVQNGTPMLCDSWGEVGDYIRGLYIHPAMKNLINRSTSAYQNPNTFFRLFNYLTREYTFANGMDVCGEYLRFGIEIGNLINWLNVYEKNRSNPYIENQIQFCSRGLINSIHEVALSFENIPDIKLSIDNIHESISSMENFCKWFLEQLEYIEHECFGVGLTFYFFFDADNRHNDIKKIYSELYASFINDIYQLIVGMLFDYLKIHNGINKSNNIVSICAKIFNYFDMHKCESPSELDNIINNIDIDKLNSKLQSVEDEFKFNFVVENAYIVFNEFKAFSYCRNNSNNVSVTTDIALKHSDVNWMIGQIKQFSITHPNAAAIIHIQEDKTVSVEISLEAGDLLLKKQLKENEVLLKISTKGIDFTSIKNLNEMLPL